MNERRQHFASVEMVMIGAISAIWLQGAIRNIHDTAHIQTETENEQDRGRRTYF